MHEFEMWLFSQTDKVGAQIANRLSKIEINGYFGDHKKVSDLVWGLKCKNNRCIYFAYLPQLHILMLIGGNKNGQSKDIAQAEKIIRKYTE
jgi:putative addiction module killer protein